MAKTKSAVFKIDFTETMALDSQKIINEWLDGLDGEVQIQNVQLSGTSVSTDMSGLVGGFWLLIVFYKQVI